METVKDLVRGQSGPALACFVFPTDTIRILHLVGISLHHEQWLRGGQVRKPRGHCGEEAAALGPRVHRDPPRPTAFIRILPFQVILLPSCSPFPPAEIAQAVTCAPTFCERRVCPDEDDEGTKDERE